VIRTRGLTHVALKVGDLDRAIAFYATLLDARVLIRNDRTAEIGTPGARDVITLEVSESRIGFARDPYWLPPGGATACRNTGGGGNRSGRDGR
jgi:catechol 2,3-dioxygenase-like lactoylglutathione lyase family enzyme